jgi:hypothetical protein
MLPGAHYYSLSKPFESSAYSHSRRAHFVKTSFFHLRQVLPTNFFRFSKGIFVERESEEKREDHSTPMLPQNKQSMLDLRLSALRMSALRMKSPHLLGHALL